MAGGLVGHDKKHCPTPTFLGGSGSERYHKNGDIWQCPCGQLWWYHYILEHKWRRISEKKRKRLEFKKSDNPERGSCFGWMVGGGL